MLTFDALARGRLTEAADGVSVVVPRGHCKVQSHDGVVQLFWSDEDGSPHGVALSVERFERHLEAGAIVIIDAAQICEMLDQRVS